VRYQNEFIPTAANVTVSGRVLTENGNGIRNTVVTITDTSGNVLVTRTSTFGYFHFYEIRVGETYVISVNSKRFIFKPSSQVINVDEELSNIYFIAYE